MKLRTVVILVVCILAMFVHGYLYILSFDINTEYGRDETRMLGTIAFIFYRLPFYIVGLGAIVIVGLVEEKFRNENSEK
jgi:hypothetical protein